MPTDARVSEIVDVLHSIRERVESGVIVDAAVSDQLMARIQGVVPQVSREDVAILHEELEGVMKLIAARHSELADELKRLRQSRKGLEGYNHIRGHDTEQRLSRIV
jgi:hypothetical protein